MQTLDSIYHPITTCTTFYCPVDYATIVQTLLREPYRNKFTCLIIILCVCNNCRLINYLYTSVDFCSAVDIFVLNEYVNRTVPKSICAFKFSIRIVPRAP